MNQNNNPILLEVNNLSTDFLIPGGESAHALSEVSFTLREGEVLGVVGESGCGKTTLMLSLMRLLPSAGRIVNGEVVFMGKDLLSMNETEIADVRWKDISMIFQGAMNALNPVKRVGDQITEAINLHMGVMNAAQVSDRVSKLLDMVGIGPERKDQYPHQYSGGMRQRAMIAMALACNPQVVIADEPTTALDVMVQAQILELMAELQAKLGLAILFVTHDLGVVAEMCDTVMVMYGGVVAEYGTVDAIFNEPQHPYTQELLRAFPDLSRPSDKLASIPGYPPRLNALPAGCRFAPRCPQVIDRCHVEMPALHQPTPNHFASCHLLDK
jgi:peptide/nickel transport system ATP-binding protein